MLECAYQSTTVKLSKARDRRVLTSKSTFVDWTVSGGSFFQMAKSTGKSPLVDILFAVEYCARGVCMLAYAVMVYLSGTR
jgi:hypothetical protein